MRRLVPVTLVGLLLLLLSASVLALGMGRVRTSSFLGDPLDFTVALSTQPGDALAEDCIRAEVFSGDSRVPDEMVRIRISRASDGSPTLLRVATGTRIDEPLARVDVALECGVSIRRSYVVFVDPPFINLAQAGSASSVSSAVTQPVPRVRDLEPTRQARRSTSRSSSRATNRSTRRSAATQSGGSGVASSARRTNVSATRAARSTRAATSTQRAAGGSSLKLESTPTLSGAAPAKPSPARVAADSALAAASAALATNTSAGIRAGASVVSGVAATAASGASSAAVSGLLGELAAKAESDAQLASAEKLRTLEENLSRLRTENQSMESTMAGLRARLVDAEQDRWSNTLVYGLLALLLLLGLAVIALLLRQAALRREADWSKPDADEPIDNEAPQPGVARSIVRPTVPAAERPGAAAAAAAAARLAGAATKPGPRATLAEAAAAKAAGTVAQDHDAETGVPRIEIPPTLPGETEPRRVGQHESTAIHDSRQEVSVDELIDLEQQADFFEVLGQDDAAVDLLMGHLQGTGGVSPLPYLKLLEIHRRRKERAAYDRVRERFNRRFAAFAPAWEEHSGHERALQDYPELVQQLQSCWNAPSQAMEALTALLFKRDDSGQTFDLPAYGELLFLYSMARDLAENEPPSDDIDLLLPLDGLPPVFDVEVAADAKAGADDILSLSPADDLADLPATNLPALDLPVTDLPVTEAPKEATRDAPEKKTSSSGAGDHDAPLELKITNDPAEPKGPLSKY